MLETGKIGLKIVLLKIENQFLKSSLNNLSQLFCIHFYLIINKNK